METTLELVLYKTIVKTEDDKIFIELVCKFFGINLLNQTERIRKDEICKNDFGKNHSYSVFGDKRLRLCLGKRGFIRWIQIINSAIVRKDLRELFVQYQVAVFDYLYVGNESKNTQLEDIRKYAENINSALRVDRQVKEYITEQKQHRDLCLATPPNEWAQIKATLIEEKILPNAPSDMRAIGAELPDDIKELRNLRHNIKTSLGRAHNVLLYRKQTAQKEENPLPEGFRKEMVKLSIKNFEGRIIEIDQKILEMSSQSFKTNNFNGVH